MPSSERYDINADLEAEYEQYLKSHNRSNTSTIDFSNLLFSLRRTLTRRGKGRQSYKNLKLPSEKEAKKKKEKSRKTKKLKSNYTFGKLSPLRSTEFVYQTRKSLMLELRPELLGCTVSDGAEVCFNCIPDIASLICQNPMSNLDLLSIGKMENGTLGVYYTVDGWKCSDGQIAEIHKVKSLSRKRKNYKYEVKLVKDSDRNNLFHIDGKEASSRKTEKQKSLLIRRRSKNFYEIVVRKGRFAVASVELEKGATHKTYSINIEPQVDACFISTLVLYALRKRLFHDDQLVGMKLHTSNITAPRIAKRVRYSISRRRKSSGIVTKLKENKEL